MRIAATLAILTIGCGRLRFDELRDAAADSVDVVAECASAPSSFAALGSGTAADPYRLCNAVQWIDLANHTEAWSAHLALVSDLDLSTIAADHPPVGTMAMPFTGVLDGRRHIIRGFTNHSAKDYLGLFGVVNGGTIADVAVRDVDLVSATESGALVGLLSAGTVRRVASYGPSCFLSVAAFSNHRGGLIGETGATATVADAFSTCRVTGGGTGIAGLIGHNAGSVTNAYYQNPMFPVASDMRVGGLVGYHYAGASVTSSFVAAAVSGSSAGNDVGAVAGTIDGIVTDTFFDTRFSVTNNAGGTSTAGTGVDGSAGYYFDPLDPPMNAWDFATVWAAQPGTFPVLAWLVGT